MKRKEPGSSDPQISDKDVNNQIHLEKDILSANTFLSLERFLQSNPSIEELHYIIHKIDSKTAAMRWSIFPKDLWPSVLIHFISPRDFHNAHLVCKPWHNLLLTESFWESYASFRWHLDPTIKSQHTVPASKYCKLRLYLTSKCSGREFWYDVDSCCANLKGSVEYSRVCTQSAVLFSKHQVGFISANWCYFDYLNYEGVMVRSSGFCCILCGDYNETWFGSLDVLVVLDTVLEGDGVSWKENEEFGEIRRMLGFKDWKELIHDVVLFCVGGAKEKEWTFESDGYTWDGFLEYYGCEMELNCASQIEFRDLPKKMKQLEKIMGLRLINV